MRCECAPRERSPDRRPSARARGYTAEWERESKAFLKLPENRHCACGCGRIADMVDHKVRHRGDMSLFWDRSNWQPMASSPCHSSKKQREERRAERETNAMQARHTVTPTQQRGAGSNPGDFRRTGGDCSRRISPMAFLNGGR